MGGRGRAPCALPGCANGMRTKAKVLQFYFEAKSVTLTLRKLRKYFRVREAPTRNGNFQIENKFPAQGIVRNNFKQHSGCKRSQRASATVARVRHAL